MVESQDKNFGRVQAFHQLMDGRLTQAPTAFSMEEALHRADFKLEEIVELVAATAENPDDFDHGMAHLHQALDKAATKVQAKTGAEEVLTGQVDALLDILYFTYGSFALMGVDPAPIFDVVHEANMGKIWPDGRAHHDPQTHKILKPANWERDFAPEAKIRDELARQIALAQKKAGGPKKQVDD